MSLKDELINSYQKGYSGNNYSKQIKLAIVAEVESGLTRRAAHLKYGIAMATIQNWVDQYGLPQNRSHRAIVSAHNRRQVARAIMEGRMSVKEAQLAYKIGHSNTIRHWVRQLRKENAELTDTNIPSMSSSTTSADQGGCDLQELSIARLKIAALETMIDIAEQQFKISIRKKSGAKQSPK